MGFIFDIFSLAVYLPFLQVDEEDISRNAAHLKKYSWFQELLNDRAYRHLIIYHPNVRQVIGRCNTDKLHKKRYNLKYERKVLKALRRDK
ncbi:MULTISPECIES: hypothetical protein [unclassified Bacillus (in: firmicutes)]|uniref:hypothetical protein n=1 Tax=unclassified Bacillus (in: firmicutes) TaxID=185979 RepID=UPI000D03330A|nr:MULTISPECIES: hypothetical protein [unclassified Bacillus (in: firmicutes)]PRR91843.1 hypothetical protein C6W21_00110 [Bacillus sp. NMCN1]PRR99474.1 hypothetical protein C6W20_00110 [Bacillus sp. NMCN6]